MGTDLKSKEIIAGLKSTDPEIVLETIGRFRESGNSLILEEFIELLHQSEDREIKKSLLNLLSELKDKASVTILIDAIKSKKYASERAELVACCWQNGLGYNEYLPFFIDLVINEEFRIAFEAFTVIENMYGRIDDQIIDIETTKLNNALKIANDQKAYLLNALLAIIADIPEKQEYQE